MRTRRRLTVTLLFALTTASVSVALAQPKGRGRPKPKTPPPASVDAGAPEPPASDETNAPATTPAPTNASDAGATAAPSPAPIGDGGVRASPLNPAPNEFPSAAPAGGAEYDKLLGDISALRARVAAVTDTLFRSRVAVAVEVDSSHAKLAKLTLSLDDGVVYTSPPTFRAEDPTLLYDHGVAPGKHAVTIEVERRDDRDESFRTVERSRFMVDVPKDQRLDVQVRLGDDSDMGKSFPKDHEGSYDLRVRVKAVAKPVGK